jgi:hypothetical protein
MKFIQDSTAKIKANPISSVIGAVAGFYVTRTYIKSTKWWALGLGTVVGLVGGAMTSSAIAARKSTPTAAATK